MERGLLPGSWLLGRAGASTESDAAKRGDGGYISQCSPSVVWQKVSANAASPTRRNGHDIIAPKSGQNLGG